MDFIGTFVVVLAVTLAAAVLVVTVVRGIANLILRKKGGAADELVMVAQVNGPKGMPEPKGDIIEAVPDSDERIAFDCGHEGAVKFHYVIFGERIEADEKRMRELHDRCPDCIVDEMRQDIIRCARCGHFILPGQDVAVYFSGRGLKKKWSTRTPDGGYIGCMRWECCPTGGLFAGRWLGREGFKPAFEHGSAMMQAFKTGKPVFGNINSTDDED